MQHANLIDNNTNTIFASIIGVISIGLLISGLVYFVLWRKKGRQECRLNSVRQAVNIGTELLESPHVFSKSCSGSSGPEQGTGSSLQCKTSETPSISLENIHELISNGKSSPTQALLGRLQFSVGYNTSAEELLVSVLHAFELPHGDLNSGIVDSFVKLELLPDKIHRVKTRVVRNNRSPFYGEAFTFDKISFESFQEISLHFFVVTFNSNLRERIIGEILFPLNDVNVSSTRELILTKEISSIELCLQNAEKHRGRLLLSLCYLPAANRITAVVLKAEGLPKAGVDNSSGNPYVKLYFYENSLRILKKKTHVKKRTSSPVFNEAFALELPEKVKLENVRLDFRVVYWDRDSPSKVVGQVSIGFHAVHESGRQHWKSVVEFPRKQVAEWHILTRLN